MTTSISYLWSNGSSTLGTNATLSLSPSTVQPGDTLTCGSITDGSGASASGTASVTVGNTDPVISSVTVSPSTAYNDTV